jgi:hypothetical protein
MMTADAKRPAAVNQRSGVAFQPGIGPHTESRTIELAVLEMRARSPQRYSSVRYDVPYPSVSRQACDLELTGEGQPPLFVEFKMIRLMGDNGKPNDNMLTHILSPYRQHRSALTDCEKLAVSGSDGRRKAVVIFGYEYPDWPFGPAIGAFELLARQRVRLPIAASGQIGGCSDYCPLGRETGPGRASRRRTILLVGGCFDAAIRRAAARSSGSAARAKPSRAQRAGRRAPAARTPDRRRTPERP